MYKALITDLDGTVAPLSSDGSDVTADTVKAVQRAQNQGKIVACATGRGWVIAKPLVQALGLIDPCVVEGGTRIIDPVSEKTLWEKTMVPESIPLVFSCFKQWGPEAVFITSENPELPERQVILNQVDSAPAGVNYMYLLGLPMPSVKAILNELNMDTNLAAHATPSWSGQGLYDIHVTHKKASKEHGIKRWHSIVGIGKAETIGMGDGGNDLPIFESVGLRVAVGNAVPELLAVADYVVPDQADGALQHVITKFLIAESN